MASSYSAYVDPVIRRSSTKYIDYDRLKHENKENLCTISVNNSSAGSITGILDTQSNISIGAKADYKDYWDNLQAFQTLQNYQGLVGSAAGGEKQMPQVSLKSLRLSEQNYMGSTVNDFNIKINVPIISQNDDPWGIAIGMLEYVIGERSSDISISDIFGIESNKIQSFVSGAEKELVIYAPHRYRIRWSNNDITKAGGAEDRPEGCANIRIGSRFKFDNMLITNVSCDFNNIVYVDGKVTDLGIQFSFRPWRLPDLSEVKRWFALRRGL